MKTIQDDLTARTDISHQRKSQIRNIRKGRCARCGLGPLVNKTHCEQCRVRSAERSLAYHRRLHPPEMAILARISRRLIKHQLIVIRLVEQYRDVRLRFMKRKNRQPTI